MRSLRERRQWRRRRRRTACAGCRTLRTQIQPAAPQHAPSFHASTVGNKRKHIGSKRLRKFPHWPCKSGPLLHNTLPLFISARSETNGNRSKTSACAGSPTLATQIQFTFPQHASSFHASTFGNSACAGSLALATQIQLTDPKHASSFYPSTVGNKWKQIGNRRLRGFIHTGHAKPARCSKTRFLFF